MPSEPGDTGFFNSTFLFSMSGETKTLPLVSIVVATYNGAKFLEAQMDSLIAQTYPNIEIVTVDDCSKDNTVEILERYAREHAHIRVFRNTSNLGYTKNFEKAVSLATGEFISFSDQDDIWAPEKTAVLMNAIGDHPMIYSDSQLVTEDLQPLRKHSELKNQQTFDNCLYFATDDCVAGHSLIMKRSIAVAAMPYPTECPYDLWLPFFATFYGEIQYVNTAFVQWRQHRSNVTGRNFDMKAKLQETRAIYLMCRDACPPALDEERSVFQQLYDSFESYSLANNFKRMQLFFKYQHYFLAMKKRNAFRKFLFCIKMFFKMKPHG
jgi:glycosyltransferase involved in cell wall biosynthesis